ncbi:hypothetical protein ACTFIV_004016 [Dictyostelium citrinum]
MTCSFIISSDVYLHMRKLQKPFINKSKWLRRIDNGNSRSNNGQRVIEKNSSSFSLFVVNQLSSIHQILNSYELIIDLNKNPFKLHPSTDHRTTLKIMNSGFK